MRIEIWFMQNSWWWKAQYKGLETKGECITFAEALEDIRIFGEIFPVQDNHPIVGSSA